MSNTAKLVKWLILIGCNLFCVVSLGLNLYDNYADIKAEYRKLDAEGIETSAEVTRMQMHEGSKGEENYEITYVFEVEGVTYTKITSANTRHNESLTQGDLVQIRYAASDPQISEIIGNEVDLSLPYRPYSYGLFACFGLMILLVPLMDFMDWHRKRATSRKATA